jgi:hypothetical protein
MAVSPPSDLIQRFVDMLLQQTKRGLTLDAALADAARYFPDDAQKAALQAAAEDIRRRASDIEHLRHPSTLRTRGRVPWYAGPRDTDDFWPPLKAYLINEKGWSTDVVESMDISSSKVISCLDFPGNPAFSTKGLVLGYVQSGKTANFTATISKAADVGFRVFLVFSGLTNSLRQQTQDRLNKELVAVSPTRWHTWTDSDKDIGDFPFNMVAMLSNKEARHLAVVKKNGPRLRRLLRMLTKGVDSRLRQDCPILIIDDECDQASVNASGISDKMTAINKLLRELITKLPRAAYIGYTATPYANVLIDPAYPEDLYPRDFIVALPKPPQYFGAERLFGRDLLDADEVPPAESGLDMIRLIKEEEIPELRPPSREHKDSFVLSITESLAKAINYYWLATAAKAARGLGGSHSCMLIHTTVYAQSHVNAKPVVEQFVLELGQAIDRRDRSVLAKLKALWLEEQQSVPAGLLGLQPLSFEELVMHLAGAEARPVVVVENAISDARLSFAEPGRRYIVIGGNVLARGLTIEELVVSYFLRTASQYDTLMQMGRWFGYRIGYEDLPRIWMTAEMVDYFRDMATVEAEIRYDIGTYERDNLDPLDFAVRVRKHPDLEVTAKGKMAAALECQISFAGEHVQIRKFREKDDDWLRHNWKAASELLIRISAKSQCLPNGGSRYFTGISFLEIVRFLAEYKIHEDHRQFADTRLINYIRQQNSAEPGSLAVWNVGVIGTESGTLSLEELGPLGKVHTSNRAKLLNTLENHADIKALMSRQDALVDLPDVPAPGAWKDIKALRDGKFPDGRPLLLLYPIARDSRPFRQNSDRMQLKAVRDVLGIAIVFPQPKRDVPLGYLRAPIDLSSFEQAEYEEEVLPDDDNTAS